MLEREYRKYRKCAQGENQDGIGSEKTLKISYYCDGDSPAWNTVMIDEIFVVQRLQHFWDFSFCKAITWRYDLKDKFI